MWRELGFAVVTADADGHGDRDRDADWVVEKWNGRQRERVYEGVVVVRIQRSEELISCVSIVDVGM